MRITLASKLVNMYGALAVTGAVTGSNLNVSDWDTAFGWGNHASGGYLTAVPSTESPDKAFELPNTQDLDDLTAAGFYYQSSNADTSGNNYPSGQAGSLLVQKSAGAATQMYITYVESGNRMFFRSKYLTAYGAWRELSQVGHTHAIANITGANEGNWDTAFGWGNHATPGYAAGNHNHDGVYLDIAGTAANSTLLGVIGMSSTGDSPTGADKVVRTNTNGYTYVGWINTVSGATTTQPVRIYGSQDAFLRYYTPANLAGFLDNEAWNFSNAAAPLRNSLGMPHHVTSGYVGGKISVVATAPSSPTKGDLWFDTS